MAKKTLRRKEDGGLTITSMMDMMTIILVFLLKSFSVDIITVEPSEDLRLPISTAEVEPQVAVNVIVSRRTIYVDGEPLLTLREGDADGRVQVPDDELEGQLISKLRDALSEAGESERRHEERMGRDVSDWSGQLLLQADRGIPFELIRQVMYTAGQAQFSEFRFVVMMGEG